MCLNRESRRVPARGPRPRSSVSPAAAARCRLPFAQQCQQHGAPIRKLQRIVMRGQLVLVDLAENRRLMVDRLCLPAKQARRQASDLAGEGQFGARHQTYRHAEIVGVGEAARSGTEITRYKLIAHFRGPRPHALEAKVTHWQLLSPRHRVRGFQCTPITPAVTSRSKNGAGYHDGHLMAKAFRMPCFRIFPSCFPKVCASSASFLRSVAVRSQRLDPGECSTRLAHFSSL